tara:strand:+ start:363 stop:815 length:453 start_codon:yes stop_codon:yes gene_type:complete
MPRFITGVIIGIFLAITPFIFYAYRLIPETTEQISFFGLTIKAGAYGNINYYAYYFLTKMVFLSCFSIWFVTCRHWWRFVILVPLAMLIFQVVGIVNTSISYIDEFDFWYSLPVVVPVLTILIYVAKRMRFYVVAMDLMDEIDDELNHES